MRGRRAVGSSFGGAVLAVAILASLSAGLANLCVSHLRLSARSDNAMHAANLARSAVAAAIARVAETPEFGREEGADSTISISYGHGHGYLSFSPSEAERLEVAHSTNNIGSNTVTTGAGDVRVPADAVHLVGLGVCNGVQRRIEVVIKVPSYPWAVAATGKLNIVSGATVGALPAGVWPPTAGDLEPADLVSNSAESDAITLSGSSHILGNVETPGGVIITGDAVVIDGQVRQGADPTDIPVLRPETYDPQARGLEFEELGNPTAVDSASASGNGADGGGDPGGDGGPNDNDVDDEGDPAGGRPPTDGAAAASGSLVLTGAARHTGDLTLDGGLRLDAGSLYVDGDLTVRGNIDGFGVLVVKNNLIVESGVQLEGATQLAVVCGGRVEMRGVGPSSTVVRGVFFAKDGLVARRMTVVGALVAGGESADITLDETSVYIQDVIAGPGPSGSSGGASGIISSLMDDAMDGATREVGPDMGSTDDTQDEPPAPTGDGGTTTAVGGPSSLLSLRERMKVVSWIER